MVEDHNKRKDKSNVCRLCLGSTNVSVSLTQHDDKSTSIIEKIHYCTSLVVKVDDDFPQNICITCSENLNLLYNFKIKAIASDLELSKNVHKDISFTYIQVSDDPLNMTYKLDLEEQESSVDIGDSCVYNIVDGDELKIEPVNVTTGNKCTTITNDENESIITESLNNDSQNSENITIKLNENVDNNKNTKTNTKTKSTVVNHKRNSNNEKSKEKKMKTDNDIDSEKPLLIVKNGKVVYICNVCNFEAESMNILLSHRTRVHFDVGNHKCSECLTSYKTPGLLKRHIALYHEVTHICKYCDKRCSNNQSLERHISVHHKITPLEFQCVKCNAYFDTMDKMEDHLVVHYMSPSSTFNCNHCDRSFTTFAAKNKHVDLEHMVEIQCNICHIVLPTKEAMDKHNNSVHQPKKKGNKMYACTTCEKQFSDIKDILSHRETHLSNKLL